MSVISDIEDCGHEGEVYEAFLARKDERNKELTFKFNALDDEKNSFQKFKLFDFFLIVREPQFELLKK